MTRRTRGTTHSQNTKGEIKFDRQMMKTKMNLERARLKLEKGRLGYK